MEEKVLLKDRSGASKTQDGPSNNINASVVWRI